MTWIWYLLLGVVYVAILYALVKPGSPAAQGIVGLSNALASLVATATATTGSATNTISTNASINQGGTLV